MSLEHDTLSDRYPCVQAEPAIDLFQSIGTPDDREAVSSVHLKYVEVGSSCPTYLPR
jgi:hypothetical protein